MTYEEQNIAAGRIIFPDLVRAFALIGICVVNVGVIAFPMMAGYSAGGLSHDVDKAAYFTVNSLFLLKSYTLFSFMFGAGFAYQMMSASRRGGGFNGLYFRRILGLIVLGVLHVAFLFQGDILVVYGILGCVLFLFRNRSARALKNWGIGIYAVQILISGFFLLAVWAGHTFDPEAMAKEVNVMSEDVQTALVIYGDGTFAQAMSRRFTEWGDVLTFGLLMQGFGALGFFLLGFSAVKSGLMNDAHSPLWKRFRRVFLPIGLVGSMVGAWWLIGGDGMMDTQMMAGMFFITVFAPFSTAGYLGLIANWTTGPSTKLKIFLARGGTASLTAYLMQGLILSLIFNAYGLGLYASIGAAGCVLIALCVGLFTVSFTSLWRKRFTRGPMEFLLRRWTYLGRKPTIRN